MAWCLLRGLCCLCNHSGVCGRAYTSHDDESDYSDDDDCIEYDRERNLKYVKAKQAAIAATTDKINIKRLLNKHGRDSGLLMYYDRNKAAVQKTYGRLAAITEDKRSIKPSRFARYQLQRDVV